MDSVTQFVLGASVGVAVMGRRMGVRKAAITGGLLGTLPDLDVFWPNDDPIDSFVTHRSATHSLILHTIATPFLGEALRRVFTGLKDHRVMAYLAVFLCLTTHALLDSLTIYGTQLFWPIWKEPLGLGSVFIIDPLYTIPLLIMTVWALFQKNWSDRYGKGLIVALLLSTSYLGWGAAAQSFAYDLGKKELSKLGIAPDQMMGTPVPFSTLFWRIIATDKTHDYSVYVPLLGGETTLTTYKNRRIPARLTCWVDKELHSEGPLKTLSDFSDGYYRLDIDEDKIRYSDLRMGLSQTYAFQFNIALLDHPEIKDLAIERMPAERQFAGDRAWIKNGILGNKSIRPIEKESLVELGFENATVPETKLMTGC